MDLPLKIRETWEAMKSQHREHLEVKQIHGHYYLYTATSVWSRDRKKPIKKTDMLGTIDLDGTFHAKKPKKKFSSMRVYEYGSSQLAWSLIADIYASLKDHPHRDSIAIMCLVKAVDPMPLRLVGSRYEKMYLSRKIRANLDPEKLSDALAYVGDRFPDLYDLFRKIMEPGGMLFYDMTAVLSYSRNLILAEKGYNADFAKDKQIAVIIAFSVHSWLPVAVDVFFGSVKDIKSFRYFVERFRDSDLGFIVDRGLFAEDLIRYFRSMRIHYIVPLKRNSTMIPLRIAYTKAFMYEKRPIRASRKRVRLGFLYSYEDPQLRAEEETTLLKDIAEGRNPIESFEDEKKPLGRFSILSDLDRDPSDIYEQYKSREEVEQVFDTMKSDLEADKTYLREENKVRGYFFIVFLALRIRFAILKVLKDRKLTGRISVKEVLLEFSKIERVVEKNGAEYFAAVPKKVEDLLEQFKDKIPMG